MAEIVIEEQLSHRVVKGGFWVFALRITQQIFYIIRLIILARILAPHDFGLLGIAMLTMLTLENFSQTGFQAALIQKKENIDEYLNTAWTVGIIRGFILFIILYFIAPYAAIFFKTPQAEPIIRVIGFSSLIQPFTNIGIIYFRKELEFNKQFIYQLTGTLTDFVVAVSAALLLRSVWALVFGLLAGNAARLIVSYLIHPYRPQISFDMTKAKELFRFGKWVLGSSILVFLITQGDDIFVVKLLGATMLGFYQMAYKISNTPATEITHVISQITFPVYSKLQDNIPKLREAFLKVLQLTAFLSFPIAGLIFVLAPDFTKIFLGEKWLPIVPVMQALCIFGITRSLGATMGSILYSVGRPKIQTKLSSIQLIAMALLIYPLTKRWGILGSSFAVIIPNLLALILITKDTKKILDFKYKDFFTSIGVQIIAIIIMFIAVFLRRNFLSATSNIINFSISLILGSSIYFGSLYLCEKTTKFNLLYTIRHSINIWF